MLTKQEFGKELKKRIMQNMAVPEIAVWVQEMYQEGISDADFDFLDLMLTLSTLDGTPDDEFEIDDLHEIAQMLIEDQDVEL